MAGALISVAHLPAAPFLWAHYIYKNGSQKAYATLEKQFSDIALQMGLVEEHLGKIEDCLDNIEKKLNQGIKVEWNLAKTKLRDTDDVKKTTLIVGRAIKVGNELMQACNKYLELIKLPKSQRELK